MSTSKVFDTIDELASRGLMTTFDIAEHTGLRLNRPVTEAFVANYLAGKRGELEAARILAEEKKAEEELNEALKEAKRKAKMAHIDQLEKRKAEKALKQAQEKKDREIVRRKLRGRQAKINAVVNEIVNSSTSKAPYTVTIGREKWRRTLINIGPDDEIVVKALTALKEIMADYNASYQRRPTQHPTKWSTARWAAIVVDKVSASTLVSTIASIIKISRLELDGDRPWLRKTVSFTRPIHEKDGEVA